MSQELIVKDNKLIEANYSLSTLQQKVLLKAISVIEPKDTKHIYKFSIMDFAEAVDLKGSKTIYRQMATICDQLTDLKKFFIKKKDGGIAYINWVASAEYIPKEAVVEVEFSQKLMPYLVELKEQFTTYYLANVMPLKSSYSIRIFELLKQYEPLKKRKIDLEELRKLVGTTEIDQNGEIIKEDYPLYGHFKSRVIVPAQKELKQKTDIYFNFTEIKEGRKVVAIEFEIKENTRNKKKIQKSSICTLTYSPSLSFVSLIKNIFPSISGASFALLPNQHSAYLSKPSVTTSTVLSSSSSLSESEINICSSMIISALRSLIFKGT